MTSLRKGISRCVRERRYQPTMGGNKMVSEAQKTRRDTPDTKRDKRPKRRRVWESKGRRGDVEEDDNREGDCQDPSLLVPSRLPFISRMSLASFDTFGQQKQNTDGKDVLPTHEV